MLHVLLAVLHIVWSGPGHPRGAALVPVIIARPISGRTQSAPRQVRLLDGSTPVWGDWRALPDESVVFSDDLAPRYYAGTPGTYVSTGSYRGPVTLRASYGGQSATLPGFAYDSAAVGCFMSFYNGVRFDDDGLAQPSGTPYLSDIFVTGAGHQPAGPPWYGCTGPFITPDAHGFAVHVPYGGTLLRASAGAFFGYVRAAQWRGDFTVSPVIKTGDILIFRTRTGRVVKLCAEGPAPDAIGGAYLVAATNGEFYDYAYYTRHPYRPHALFGPSHS